MNKHTEGEVYFRIVYPDSGFLYPLIESFVYIGINLSDEDDGDTWYFQFADDYAKHGSFLKSPLCQHSNCKVCCVDNSELSSMYCATELTRKTEPGMTKPNYCIRITGDNLTKNQVSCTGKQLCMILDILCENGKEMAWYAADVTLISTRKDWSLFESVSPAIVGDSSKFFELCKQVEQFTSGVFLAVYHNYPKPWIKTYETEDETFTDNECADVEIRAFDTSYFEIYSKKLNVLTPFIDLFGCELTRKSEP